MRREEAAERRAEEPERKRERRELWLRQIDDTQVDYLGSIAWLMYRCTGSQEHMDRARSGDEHWPHAQWFLMADEALLDQVFALKSELSAREPGSGFSHNDAARIGALQGMCSPGWKRSVSGSGAARTLSGLARSG